MILKYIKNFFQACCDYILNFIIIILIFTFVVAFHPVAGNSMIPTLEEGNVVVVSKFANKLFKMKRNQIVILKKESKSYIKRIVGLPGENISFLDNILYIDGTPYKEEFLNKNVITNNFLFEDICNNNECPDNKIPKDYYLVLGDNRGNSEDSRDFGLINKNDIKGVVLFNIWPINSIKNVS